MRPPSRTPLNVAIVHVTAQGDARLTLEELAALAGLSAPVLERLVRLGLVQPVAPETNVFPVAAAVRLKRLLRLRRDLELHLAGAAVIVDLLERLEELESELKQVRAGTTTGSESRTGESASGE